MEACLLLLAHEVQAGAVGKGVFSSVVLVMKYSVLGGLHGTCMWSFSIS